MKFNIRVYGILFSGDFLYVTDEERFGQQFTKFPGGGLESKEGILDCLKREFKEELAIEICNPQLFHINENYIQSAFNKEDQIISVYYLIESEELNKIPLTTTRFDFKGSKQIFRMVALSHLEEADFKFPSDKEVVKKLKDFKG